jgi:hypothetical protein
VAQLTAEIGNITEAIATGMMRASAALGSRLKAAEDELERLERDQATETTQAIDVERVIPGLPALFGRLADDLERTLASGDIPRSRHEIKRNVGMVTVEADEREIRLLSDQGHVSAALLRSSGNNAIKIGSGGRI